MLPPFALLSKCRLLAQAMAPGLYHFTLSPVYKLYIESSYIHTISAKKKNLKSEKKFKYIYTVYIYSIHVGIIF